MANNTRDIDYSTWQKRFGHISSIRIERLIKITKGLTKLIQAPLSNLPCDTCALAKQTKIINRAALERATRVLERVYTDFAGPIEQRLDGKAYLLIFTNKYSRKTWAYPTARRADVYYVFRRWRTHVEVQSGKTVRAMKADNAQEYVGLAKAIEPLGIAVKFTVPNLATYDT